MIFANPIVAAGVAGLQSLYADRAVTPVEACEAYLSRIRGLDGTLGAYVHVDEAGARAAAHASAERWRNGAALSPLDGCPIGVKANIAVEGWPWHAGIEAYRSRIAEADAPCIAHLRQNGAVLLGLLNMHEGAFGATTDNPWFGRTHNPWRHGFMAGGSSGGSAAATAAGLCAGALGSDTLGSVRIPASFCGGYSLKPSNGLISTDGVIAMSWLLDHVGVHGRSAADVGRLLAGACGVEAEIAGDIAAPSAPAALAAEPFAALRLTEDLAVDPEQAAAFEANVRRARDAGLSVDEIDLDGYPFREARRQAIVISEVESFVEHEAALTAAPEGFSAAYRERLVRAGMGGAAGLAKAYRQLAAYAEAAREALSPYAAVLAPTTPGPAAAFGQEIPDAGLLTTLANVTALPAAAFPVGFNRDGLPLSVQALAWDERTALGLAALLSVETDAPPSFRG